ncbi:unnamed protein product [Clavelina lepadiformis]|uniref:Uncharacterized protein n=1 Tax=Clavelina lepadiformis TaxID=159417 RepID=A0ABP0GI55_CLALP
MTTTMTMNTRPERTVSKAPTYREEDEEAQTIVVDVICWSETYTAKQKEHETTLKTLTRKNATSIEKPKSKEQLVPVTSGHQIPCNNCRPPSPKMDWQITEHEVNKNATSSQNCR